MKNYDHERQARARKEDLRVLHKQLPLSPVERDALNAFCKSRGIEASPLIRRLVFEYIDREEARVNSKKKKA